MRIRLGFAAALTLAVAAALPPACFSQSTPNQIGPQNATGIQAYDPYGGVRENINLGNGDLNLQIPLVSIPGRNGHDFPLTLHYDSKVWNPHSEYDPDTGLTFYYWDTDQTIGVIGSFGWHFNVPILTSTVIQPFISNPNYYCYGRFILITADGSKHAFFGTNPLVGVRTGCYLVTGQGNVPHPEVNIPIGGANDGSYLLLDTSNSADTVVRAKDGTTIHFSSYQGTTIASKIEDTNGNIISFSGIQSMTDTVGRTVTISSGSPRTISYKDSTGTQRTITLAFTTQTTSPTFQLPAGSNPGSGSASLLTSITLPNNLSYTFQYNTYGELTKVTYPTGGYTRYDYTRYANWVQSLPPNPAFAADFREVSAKYVCKIPAGNCSPGTTPENVTTYTPTVDGTKTNNQYMDVVSPLLDRTRHQFSYLPSSVTYSNFYSMRETLRYHYQGQNTLLRTVQTDYNNLDANGNTQNISLPIRETTTLNDVSPTLISKTEWDYSGTTDNVSEERDYDFGSGVVGPLLRKKDYTWLAVNPVNSQDYTANSLHILNRKASEQIKDASGNVIAQTQFEYDNYAANGNISTSGAVQHDSTFGITFTTRGNATTVKRWRNTDGAWLNTNNQYDDAGNVLKTTDPLGHQTQFSYSDSWGNTSCTPVGGSAAAYVTSATDALLHVTSSAYNSCTGTPSSATDANSKTTTFTYDLMNRELTRNFPDGGLRSMTYNDVLPASYTSSMKITSSPSILSLASTTIVDGLGRSMQLQLTSDSQGTDLTDFTYDAVERKSTVSNPYRTTSDSTYGITAYQYDALDRVIKVIPPDGTSSANNVTTSYIGNCTTVTDQAGKNRKSCSDALGRLTGVWENPSSLNYETDYQYDVLDNLIRIDQKGGDPNSANWRSRTFAYDSLSRILCAANPEIQIVACPNPDNGTYTSGTVRYSYDAVGNILTKKSPKPNQTSASVTVTTTFSYDALNRLTGKSFDNGDPTINYAYDGVVPTSWPSGCPVGSFSFGSAVGKRTAMCDAGGMELWGYSITSGTGWKTTDQRTTNGATKTTTYQYNLAGLLTTLTYPTGRVITYTFDGAARTSKAVDVANSVNYVTGTCANGSDNFGVCYTPFGGPSSLLNGSNLTSSFYYNSRLQPCRMSAKISGTAPTACTDAVVGNILDFNYNFGFGTSDNGNVVKITNNRDTNRSINYSYDNLNRIASAYTDGNLWGETYQIDPWGNLNKITAYAGKPQPENLNQSAGPSNRFIGLSYDAAGNLLNDGVSNYIYDGENRITTGASVQYVYDGDGRRVKKSSGKLYWYGLGSNPLDETDLAGNINNSSFNEYIFFGNRRMARRDYSNNVFYYVADHLGTSRAILQSGQSSACYDADFYPYGVQRTPVVDTCLQNYKFTSKERDSETGLDNFGVRFNDPTLGRFMSPDAGAFHFENPQSLNRYSYTLNNPIYYIDPDGNDSMSAVYSLGVVYVNTFVPQGPPVDTAGFLASPRGGVEHLSLRDLQNSQSMGSAREVDSAGGGCVLGCATVFDIIPKTYSLTLSFSYDENTKEITGVNITVDLIQDSHPLTIGPRVRLYRHGLPGMAPPPEPFGGRIDPDTLRKLSQNELDALLSAVVGRNDPFSRMLREAVLREEERRREEEEEKRRQERKKEGVV